MANELENRPGHAPDDYWTPGRSSIPGVDTSQTAGHGHYHPSHPRRLEDAYTIPSATEAPAEELLDAEENPRSLRERYDDLEARYQEYEQLAREKFGDEFVDWSKYGAQKWGEHKTGLDLSKGIKGGIKKAVKRQLYVWLTPLVVIAIVIATFSIIMGPGQFVHYAQLLHRFHFATSQTVMGYRGGLLIKFAYTRQNPIQRNMTLVGNVFADRWENRLRQKGITPEYGNRRIKALVINTNRPEGREALQKLKKIGIDVDSLRPDDNGRVRVSVDREGLGSSRHRRLANAAVVEVLGMRTIPSFLAKRSLNARGGVRNWHPFDNAVRSADESLRDYYDRLREQRKEYIKTGADTTVRRGSAGSSTDDQGNTTTSPNDSRAADDANEIIGDAANKDDPVETRTDKIKGKLTSGVGAAGYVATVCAIKLIGDEAYNLQQANIVLPLMRGAVLTQSQGSQVKYGNKTLNMEELGAASERFYDPKTDTTYAEARSIQAELGQKQDGPDMPDAAKPGKDKPGFFKVVDGVIAAVPGAGGVCSAVNSTVGGWILTGLGVTLTATGPIGAVVNGLSATAQYILAGAFLDDLVRWISGEQVDDDARGALAGNYDNYGARLAANEVSLSQGGAELSRAQEIALDTEMRAIDRAVNENSSVYARYFDPTNVNSLAAKTFYESPVASSSLPRTMASIFKPTTLFSSVGSLFSGWSTTASAASNYDYGFPEYGFTLEELDDERFEDPYKNAEFVEPHLATLNEEYGKPCFGTTIDPETFTVDSTHPNGNGMKYKEIPDKCKDRDNELLTRYRFYIIDMITARAMSCYEFDDEQACEEVGAGASATDTSTDGSADVPSDGDTGLPSGTTQSLALQIVNSRNVTGDPRYMEQIRAAARGSTSCHMNPTILGLIIKISERHNIFITSLNRRCTGVITRSGEASYHYRESGGHAVDIGIVDGVVTTGVTDAEIDLIKEIVPLLPSGSGLGQSDCRARQGKSISTPADIDQFPDECDHIHIQVPVK